MTTPASPTKLDVAAIKRSFTEDGYFVIPSCVSKAELESVEKRMFDAFDDWKRGSGDLSVTIKTGDAPPRVVELKRRH